MPEVTNIDDMVDNIPDEHLRWIVESTDVGHVRERIRDALKGKELEGYSK